MCVHFRSMSLTDVRKAGSFDKRDWYFSGGVTNFTRKERDALSMDAEGLFSTTQALDAQRTTQAIAELPGLSCSTLKRRPVITDACACCGGNAMSFLCSNMFEHVNIVEIDPVRCAEHLTPNVRFAVQARGPHTSYTIINANYVPTHSELAQDVVFLDVPWGGPTYKNSERLNLSLSGVSLGTLAVQILKSRCLASNASTPSNAPRTIISKYVVMKLPMNFDVQKLQSDAEAEGCLCTLLRSFRKFNLYVMQLGWRESVL